MSKDPEPMLDGEGNPVPSAYPTGEDAVAGVAPVVEDPNADPPKKRAAKDEGDK